MRATTKVCFFLNNLNGGGAERVVVKLLNELVDEDIDIELVLSQMTGPYLKELNTSIKVVDLNCKSKLLAIFKLSAHLRKTKPNIVFSTITGANIIALLAKSISFVDCKSIIREANTPSMEDKHLGFKTKILSKLAKKLYPLADCIVCVSKDSHADFVGFFTNVDTNKIKVIYNPVVDTEFLEKMQQKPAITTPWIENPPYFLGVGRLSEQKDFHSLIHAFSRVREKHVCKLIILGEGPLRESHTDEIVKLELSQDVWMPGFVENPYPYMREADAFVLSSRWEGLPNVLIQALATGTQIISTNCPSGPREILQDGELGKLVTVGDVSRMADAMIDSLESPTPFTTKQNAVAFAQETFNTQFIKMKYLALFRDHSTNKQPRSAS
ncbi:4-alpha-N-acetylgalactosaminyltransferase [compost metagenome]